jgi:hypothetical protein
MHMSKSLLFTSICLIFAASAIGVPAEAAKDKRSTLSEAQKKKMRADARAYCMKNYVKGLKELDRVEIQSTGKVICWIRQ